MKFKCKHDAKKPLNRFMIYLHPFLSHSAYLKPHARAVLSLSKIIVHQFSDTPNFSQDYLSSLLSHMRRSVQVPFAFAHGVSSNLHLKYCSRSCRRNQRLDVAVESHEEGSRTVEDGNGIQAYYETL